MDMDDWTDAGIATALGLAAAPPAGDHRAGAAARMVAEPQARGQGNGVDLTPPTSPDFRLHRAQCSKRSCAKCTITRGSRVWDTYIDLQLCGKRRWLHWRRDAASACGLFLGCWICALFGGRDTFAECKSNSVQKCTVSRHSNSAAHRVAISRYLAQLGLSAAELVTAPSPELFQAVLRKTRLGERRVAGVSPGKRRCMLWCLAEAVRDVQREFLRTAACIGLAQDTRKGYCLIRYIAASKSTQTLDVQSGVLGLVYVPSASALVLRRAVLHGIKQLSTCRLATGRISKRVATGNGTFDKELATHIRTHVEVFAADGAADEQLTGRMLMGSSGRGADSELGAAMPRLRLITRDKAHASRRLLQRTWTADVYINNLTGLILYAKGSLAKLLEYSLPFQERFARYQKDANPTQLRALQNLSFAKQRFDSAAVPLGRLVLCMDAALSVLDDILKERAHGSREHNAAVEIAEMLDTEACLQLAMLADSAHDVLALTRFFDKDSYDVAEMPRILCDFQHRCKAMWVQGGCLHGGDTFTSHMLTFLARPRLLWQRDGPKTLGLRGGVPVQTQERCLARMQNWYTLAESVLRTEFPHFELLNGFSALSLRSKKPKLGLLEPVCRCLEIDFGKMQVELDGLWPLAVHMFHGDTLEAWRAAVQHSQGTYKRRKCYPLGEGLRMLRRLACYTGSTCGVEQNFSVLQRVTKGCYYSPFGMLMMALVATSADIAADSKLVGAARLIWQQAFGRSMSFVKRVRLRSSKKPTGEKGWLRKRMAANRGAWHPRTIIPCDGLADVRAQLWGDKQQRELLRQGKLQQERESEAVALGMHAGLRVLVPPEDVDNHKRKQSKCETEYMKRHARLEAGRTVKANIPAGSTLFFEDGCWDGSLHAGLVARGWRRVHERCSADVQVALDPTAPHPLGKLVAILAGGVVGTPLLLGTSR